MLTEINILVFVYLYFYFTGGTWLFFTPFCIDAFRLLRTGGDGVA